MIHPRRLFSIPALSAAAALALLASCAPRVVPQPQQEAEPVGTAPAPAPAPIPPPPEFDWRDAPLSAGDWTYRSDGGGGSSAWFGPAGAPTFLVRCERGRQVTLARLGIGAGNALAIRTSSQVRALPARPGENALSAVLPASDRLLDAMVFSRGRFTVEAQGVPVLIVPAWPEPARVVEDCRT